MPVAGARRAFKRAQPVAVRFAPAAGVLRTREGEVAYRAGDALLTGPHRERWPVQRHRFDAAYVAVGDTLAGQPGQYSKRYREVWALRLDRPASVKVGWQHSPVEGKPGDWLVQYGPGNFGVVAAAIFDATYELLDGGASTTR
ncbi:MULTISPECIES: PGDYG domain-containing protein [unclassified Janthinobacterium]|uniref:PGDYG domain-containing protein n=1 Tax=unclassified Janthinobacterium TaxID=2610881 RepID=UPI0012FB9128|nr:MULTISPECIES: PGDYG domain-containing protein [unclassified Janthinobacterium]